MSASVPRFPVSTYRLQLNKDLTFAAVIDLIPYFSRLGVTHLYLSPIWLARPGSAHGYDVCDSGQINPELGGESGFNNLSAVAAERGIGVILDFVSNHVSADPLRNPAWRETLRNGPSSPFSAYFDIDWHPVKDELNNKVLLPILGSQYGDVLEAGEIRLVFDGREFSVQYWDHNLPLNPRQCRLILRHRLDKLKETLVDESDILNEYLSILFQLDSLPSYHESAQEPREDRIRELSIAGGRLERLFEQSPVVRGHVEGNVAEFNGHPNDPASFDSLHELLELQVYRLSYWRTAVHEINYRRFFDINELVGLRMENPSVFRDAHLKAFELLRSHRAHGLRLDHIDGLFDPLGYLRRLRAELQEGAPDTYIVVEKILSESEPLMADWPVDGTTGYEFLNSLNLLYVQVANMEAIRRIYSHFTRGPARFDSVIYASKQQIIATSMASELNVLAHELNRISEEDRRTRDFTLDSLQEALGEIVACFPVYRTYISETALSLRDRDVIDTAIREVIERNPAVEASIFHFIRGCLFPERQDGEAENTYLRRLRLAMKFQQYTGPVQAKSIEDTAFYRYCPLASLNEVGGDPARLGSPVEDFHSANARRQASHPRSMITTSTHDTKRGEDARARINVLSEMPAEWRKQLRQWSRVTAGARTRIGATFAPDRNDEYLFYQNLLAIWPASAEVAETSIVQRMQEYMAKAIKEAKTHSSWINPSNEYDEATARFISQVLTAKPSGPFLELFRPFARRVAKLSELNSLSQLTLKLAAPGVPDFYQGTEFWDLTLVDPDNRRPVDFEFRDRWLTESALDVSTDDGLRPMGSMKAAITALGLRLRRQEAEVFINGSYSPLLATGPHADHVVGFSREAGDRLIVAVAMRWFAGFMEADEDFDTAAEKLADTLVHLPESAVGRTFVNAFTHQRVQAGETIGLTQLFRLLPGCLLLSASE